MAWWPDLPTAGQVGLARENSVGPGFKDKQKVARWTAAGTCVRRPWRGSNTDLQDAERPAWLKLREQQEWGTKVACSSRAC